MTTTSVTRHNREPLYRGELEQVLRLSAETLPRLARLGCIPDYHSLDPFDAWKLMEWLPVNPENHTDTALQTLQRRHASVREYVEKHGTIPNTYAA